MSNNKQSSIEWLMNQALEWSRDRETGCHYMKFPSNAFKEAKAMHKEELEFAFKGGMNLVEGRLWKPVDLFEEFYNEKFNDAKK